MRIILNEKKYVEEYLKKKELPNDIGLKFFFKLVGKTIYNSEITRSEFVNKMYDIIKEFNISPLIIQEYQMKPLFETIYKNFVDKPERALLKEMDQIPLYQKEVDIINTATADIEKRVLATCYILARVMGGSGWLNMENWSGLFNVAGVHATLERQTEIIRSLRMQGLITFSQLNTNLSIKVEMHPEGEPVFYVNELEKVGNKFLGAFKKGYKQCQECGRLIKIVNNRTSFCKKCAAKRVSNSKKEYKQGAAKR